MHNREKFFGTDSRTQFLEVNMQASAAQRIGFIRRLMNRSMQRIVPPERHKLYLNHLVDEGSPAVEALQLTDSKLVGYASSTCHSDHTDCFLTFNQPLAVVLALVHAIVLAQRSV